MGSLSSLKISLLYVRLCDSNHSGSDLDLYNSILNDQRITKNPLSSFHTIFMNFIHKGQGNVGGDVVLVCLMVLKATNVKGFCTYHSLIEGMQNDSYRTPPPDQQKFFS